MKKGMKLIALVAFVCAALSCGQGITSGGKGLTLPQEDKAVFTGSGIVFSYDEATNKETKLYDAFRNVRVVFKKDGTYEITGEEYLKDENKWIDKGRGTGPYTISNNLLNFLGMNFIYSYQGTTLILKSRDWGVVFILSSKTLTSLIPQTVSSIVLPS
ncbi:hypothetical protein [Treponema sp. OMZ 855]|uniref:hypothetical protein n=1 Tax=Treponema sp. OMZ 855 TaxID=1643512 RepID=UPI0020A32C19|nr:hypothetical protein [Treponema sp. OMZ 855]UTC49848.1 hypothetical protein E4N65_06945 [Treponema sp. OMZ 855]